MKKNRGKIKKIVISLIVVIGIGAFISVKAAIKYKNKSNELVFLKNMGYQQYDIQKLRNIREAYEESLNIKEIDYNWEEEFADSNNPKEIVIHHTSTTRETPEQINSVHKEKGWNGIGYHFYITKDGTIYRGRPEEVIGSHVYGRNRDTIGICLEGNFETEKPTEEEIQSLVEISSDMIIKYNIEDIEGHCNLNNTLCPGKNFPMSDYKQKVVDNLKSMYNS